MNLRRAAALIPWRFGKRADNRDFVCLRKRQNAVIVFQKNCACRRHFSCKSVVRSVVANVTVALGLFAFLDVFQNVRNRLIKVFHGKRAVVHRVDNRLIVQAVIAGHFKVDTAFHAFDAAVDCAPVGDDHTLKAELVAQNFVNHLVAFRDVFAVKAVVAAHNLPRIRAFDRGFKSGEIYFAKSALVNDCVNRHTAVFLIVRAVVFQTCTDVFGLKPVDERGSHLSRKIRIFRKIFKIPAAKGRTFDIRAGSEHRGYALRRRFLSDCFCTFVSEVSVPRTAVNDKRGETSRRNAVFHHVGDAAALDFFTRAVRTVRHFHRRDTEPFNGISRPERLAA